MLSIKDMAKKLGVNEWVIRYAVRQGFLTPKKMRGKRRFFAIDQVRECAEYASVLQTHGK